jgi:hypothetical protein
MGHHTISDGATQGSKTSSRSNLSRCIHNQIRHVPEPGFTPGSAPGETQLCDVTDADKVSAISKACCDFGHDLFVERRVMVSLAVALLVKEHFLCSITLQGWVFV